MADYWGQALAVGSHGTALSALIHAYDPAFGYGDFERIRLVMPWVVRFTFDGGPGAVGAHPHIRTVFPV